MATHKTATRTISNASALRAIGLFPSRKNGEGIPWESQIERDAFLYLEFEADVRKYVCQPETFIIEDGFGTRFRYTPDILVIREMDGALTSQYIEVKSASALEEPDIAKRLEAIEVHFRRHGQTFEIYTDDFLRQGHRIHNYRLLYRYIGDPVEERSLSALYQLLPDDKSRLFGDLCQAFSDGGLRIAHLYSACATRILQFDLLGERLGSLTPVWRNV